MPKTKQKRKKLFRRTRKNVRKTRRGGTFAKKLGSSAVTVGRSLATNAANKTLPGVKSAVQSTFTAAKGLPVDIGKEFITGELKKVPSSGDVYSMYDFKTKGSKPDLIDMYGKENISKPPNTFENNSNSNSILYSKLY